MKRRHVILALVLLASGCDRKAIQFETFKWAENHKSMDFYGKIIDQDARPVEGVRVRAGVGTIVSIVESGGENYYTVSDAEGRFSFTGIHGAGCGYWLSKDGYEFNQRLPCSSRPKDYVPDPNKPVVFPVWKLKGAEPMIKARIHAYIPCDGTPMTFDLTTGRQTLSGGDLTVRLSRNPVQIVRGKPFDWKLTVEISGGGVQEINNLYYNEAPADGYRQSVTISKAAGAKDWTPDLQRAYYFTARSGQYFGRINVDLTGDFQPPPTSFDADVYANPASSRNLEFTRSKQIEVPGAVPLINMD
jgi:hypothetical protein